jgi:hypothetical protein
MRGLRQCLAIVAMLAASQAVAGCGGSTHASASTDASWVRTETPLFVFDKKGRLFRAGFDRRPWTLVSDHSLRAQPIVEVTNGGRWIMYREESLTTIPNPRTWLFDTRTGQDKALGSHDRPFLSPDGRLLLRYVGGGLELRDTGTQAARVVPVPPTEDYRALDWSVDGELLMWAGNDPRRTWILDPKQDRFVPIEGGLDPGVGTYYLRGDKRIALDIEPMAPNHLMRMESISPEARLRRKWARDTSSRCAWARNRPAPWRQVASTTAKAP